MEYAALVTFFQMTQDALRWLGTTGITIILIFIGAWLVRRLLGVVTTIGVKRALHFEQVVSTIDLDREKRMKTFASLINAILSVVIWAMAILLALQEAGINTAPLLAGAGVLGVGLAFGTQALVKDFVTGLFIALENQYRVGDKVELDSTQGVVEHLGVRTTILRDKDGNIHFVPNGTIGRTVNKSMGFAELRFSVKIDTVESGKTKEIIDSLGLKMQSEKKWAPQFSRPFEVITTTAKDKSAEYIVSGQVKNAYHADTMLDFQKRLRDKVEQKNLMVKKIKIVKDADTKAKK